MTTSPCTYTQALLTAQAKSIQLEMVRLATSEGYISEQENKIAVKNILVSAGIQFTKK